MAARGARISDEEANAALAGLDAYDRRCLDRCARCELRRMIYAGIEGSAAYGHCLRLALKRLMAAGISPREVEFSEDENEA